MRFYLNPLLTRTAWKLDKLYKKPEELYKASYDCFKKAVEDQTILDQLEITDVEKEALLKTIRQVFLDLIVLNNSRFKNLKI